MTRTQNNADAKTIELWLLSVGHKQDIDAFEALFCYFGPKIRAYMRKRTIEPQFAEDLMQETMVMIWRKAALFDPVRGTASSWIYTIARNIRVDAYRKNQRPQFDPDDPTLMPQGTQPADIAIEKAQSADMVKQAMKKLPQDQIDLLTLAFFEEISHSHIAKKLNLPLGTVKSRIRLAFSKLRDTLGD